MRYRLKCYKMWRSTAWNRGHSAGYKLVLSHYPREQALIKRLERYYYAHVNNCLKQKCAVCASLEEKE